MNGLNRFFAAILPGADLRIGDEVRFEPDERTLGWSHNLGGLYPGYVGRITRIKQSQLGDTIVYLDDKPVGFDSSGFKMVRRGPR